MIDQLLNVITEVDRWVSLY